MSLTRLIPDAITLDVDVDVDVSVAIDDDELDVIADAVDEHIRHKFAQHRADTESDNRRFDGFTG